MEIANNVLDAGKLLNEFASRPASIIYLGVIALLLISEWRNPTDLNGIISKIVILLIVFAIVTYGNTRYFKSYWKNYNK